MKNSNTVFFEEFLRTTIWKLWYVIGSVTVYDQDTNVIQLETKTYILNRVYEHHITRIPVDKITNVEVQSIKSFWKPLFMTIVFLVIIIVSFVIKQQFIDAFIRIVGMTGLGASFCILLCNIISSQDQVIIMVPQKVYRVICRPKIAADLLNVLIPVPDPMDIIS